MVMVSTKCAQWGPKGVSDLTLSSENELAFMIRAHIAKACRPLGAASSIIKRSGRSGPWFVRLMRNAESFVQFRYERRIPSITERRGYLYQVEQRRRIDTKPDQQN